MYTDRGLWSAELLKWWFDCFNIKVWRFKTIATKLLHHQKVISSTLSPLYVDILSDISDRKKELHNGLDLITIRTTYVGEYTDHNNLIILNNGDYRSQPLYVLRCNVKASIQYHTIHLFQIPVPVLSIVDTPPVYHVTTCVWLENMWNSPLLLHFWGKKEVEVVCVFVNVQKDGAVVALELTDGLDGRCWKIPLVYLLTVRDHVPDPQGLKNVQFKCEKYEIQVISLTWIK